MFREDVDSAGAARATVAVTPRMPVKIAEVFIVLIFKGCDVVSAGLSVRLISIGVLDRIRYIYNRENDLHKRQNLNWYASV